MKRIKFPNGQDEVRRLEHNSCDAGNLEKEETQRQGLQSALLGAAALIAGHQLAAAPGELTLVGVWLRSASFLLSGAEFKAAAPHSV